MQHRTANDLRHAPFPTDFGAARCLMIDIDKDSGTIARVGIPAGRTVTEVAIVKQEVIDGVLTSTVFDGDITIKVGDADDLDRLFATANNFPTVAAPDIARPYVKYDVDTDIYVTVTQTTTTTGSATVYVWYN